eukprot:4991592-Pleurochrysis_carterae.AAC.1
MTEDNVRLCALHELAEGRKCLMRFRLHWTFYAVLKAGRPAARSIYRCRLPRAEKQQSARAT